MKKQITVLLCLIFMFININTINADDTELSINVPAHVTFVDGGKTTEKDVYLYAKMEEPEVNVPENKYFDGFYFTYNNKEIRWDFENDYITPEILPDGMNLTLTARYSNKPVKKEVKTKIVISTNNKKNFLNASFLIDEDAYTVLSYEKGKKIKIELNVTETKDADNEEADAIKKKCEENNQNILCLFEIILNKTVSGTTSPITSLNKKAKITITIPDELYDANCVYTIYRAHVDENDNITAEEIYTGKADEDKTITFESDKFSVYALSKEKETEETEELVPAVSEEITVEEKSDVNLPLIIAGAVGFVIVSALIVVIAKRKRK